MILFGSSLGAVLTQLIPPLIILYFIGACLVFGIIFTLINAVNLYMEENERAETDAQADAIIEDQIEMGLGHYPLNYPMNENSEGLLEF